MYKKSMINLLVSLVVGLGVAFSSAVWAKNPVAAVKNMDNNGDGKVSLNEWSKPPFVFKKIEGHDNLSDSFLNIPSKTL